LIARRLRVRLHVGEDPQELLESGLVGPQSGNVPYVMHSRVDAIAGEEVRSVDEMPEPAPVKFHGPDFGDATGDSESASSVT
jgi:hypothetical protein